MQGLIYSRQSANIQQANRSKDGKMRYEDPDVLSKGEEEVPCRQEKLFAALQAAKGSSPEEKSRAGAMRLRRGCGYVESSGVGVGVGVVCVWGGG